MTLEGQGVSASLMDAGLFLFHNARELIKAGHGPYLYLPKLEHYLEARWWSRVLSWCEDRLQLERGTIKTTVLIETLPAGFQMDEILHELRERMVGLNCGRWDYIFSYIKVLQNHPDRVLPDRAQVGMAVGFLRNYSLQLIRTCHRRGVLAMGGMAAQIPVKNDDQANQVAFDAVRADKQREAGNGHDGTWVAHPGLISLAMDVFDQFMPGPNQMDRMPEGEPITRDQLLVTPPGTRTEAGGRGNVDVAIRYLASQGYTPCECATEEEARARVEELLAKKQWPCFFFDSDTTGEKDFEEFYATDDQLQMDRFDAIGIVKKPAFTGAAGLDTFLEALEGLRRRGSWSRTDLLDLLESILPDFRHQEMNRFLDGRM